MRRSLVVIALSTIVLTAGCGSGDEAPPSATAPAQSEEATDPEVPDADTDASETPVADLDAEAVILGLGEALPIALTIVYDADTDPNQRLGRPGGYTSKASFTDDRVDAADAQTTDLGSVDLGGGVEVFGSADAARERGVSIQEIQAGTGFLAREYQFVSGGVLLRIAAGLTPDEAATYGDVLADLTGEPAEPITVD